VNALLLAQGYSSAKHSGVKALFHRHCIKEALLDGESGKFYDMLFDTRQKSDYADLVRYAVEDVKPWQEKAIAFVNAIKLIITGMPM
jgi:uncharacterized protein (UPF0332 family)